MASVEIEMSLADIWDINRPGAEMERRLDQANNWRLFKVRDSTGGGRTGEGDERSSPLPTPERPTRGSNTSLGPVQAMARREEIQRLEEKTGTRPPRSERDRYSERRLQELKAKLYEQDKAKKLRIEEENLKRTKKRRDMPNVEIIGPDHPEWERATGRKGGGEDRRIVIAGRQNESSGPRTIYEQMNNQAASGIGFGIGGVGGDSDDGWSRLKRDPEKQKEHTERENWRMTEEESYIHDPFYDGTDNRDY